MKFTRNRGRPLPEGRAGIPGAAALILLAAALVSCGPLHHGYMPSGPGSLMDRPCREGLRDLLMVDLAPGARLQIDARATYVYPTGYEQIVLDMHLLLAPGTEAALASPEILLRSSSWEEPRKLKVGKIVDWTSEKVPLPEYAPTETLRGSEASNEYPAYRIQFADPGLRSETRIEVVDWFEMELPQVKVDGDIVAPDPIRFDEYKKRTAPTCMD